jgi:hypothetical protein
MKTGYLLEGKLKDENGILLGRENESILEKGSDSK